MQAHLLNDEASLSKIRKLVRADLVKMGARPSAVFDCLVAVTEACTNALHDSGTEPGMLPKISWLVDRQRAEFCVEYISAVRDGGHHRPSRSLRHVLENEGLKGLSEDVVESLMDEVDVHEERAMRSVRMVKDLR